MAKTLVIKGANFNANKIDTVQFDRVHTTAIELTEETLFLSGVIGTTHQLEYTLTPTNAEDPVMWASSDTSVCTVSETGIVSVTGVGTATITATSNGHSDTCSVTTEVILSGYTKAIKTRVSPNSASGHASQVQTYIGQVYTNYDNLMAMLAVDNTKEKLNANYNFAHLNSGTNKYYLPDEYSSDTSEYFVMEEIGYVVPIVLSEGCTKIKCVALNEHYGAYPMFCKSETRSSSSDESQYYFSAYKEAGPQPNNYSWDYKASKEFTIPSGYDSVVVLWQADTANGATSFASMTEEQLAEFKIVCI